MRRIALYLGVLFSIFVMGLAGSGYRDETLRAKPLLPVAFDHNDHSNENCTECHHNFVDDTGEGICYVCHKNDETLALDMQDAFHDFCRGCHIEKRLADEDGGPLRRCSQCHNSEDPLSVYETYGIITTD